MKHVGFFAAVAVVCAALDLLTKLQTCGTEIPKCPSCLASKEGMPRPDDCSGHIRLNSGQVPIIRQFLAFGHTRNPGIVFGLFAQAKLIFLVVSILAVPAIVAIFASVRKPRWILTVSLGLILAGTLGNLFDRAAYSEVRDFIRFNFKDYVWPLFNLADSYICVGVLLLSIEMLFFDEKKKKKENEDAGKKLEVATAGAGSGGSPPAGLEGTPPAGAASAADSGAPPPGPGPVDGDRPAPAG